MKTKLISIGAVAVLALAGCGDGGEAETEQADGPVIPAGVDEVEAAEIEAQWEEEQRGDPWEDIPDDAPIHDMTEEDFMREFWECDDSETLEECEDRYWAEWDEDVVDYEVNECQEMIQEYEQTGARMMTCSSGMMPNDEFYELYEERTGETVPDVMRSDD